MTLFVITCKDFGSWLLIVIININLLVAATATATDDNDNDKQNGDDDDDDDYDYDLANKTDGKLSLSYFIVIYSFCTVS